MSLRNYERVEFCCWIKVSFGIAELIFRQDFPWTHLVRITKNTTRFPVFILLGAGMEVSVIGGMFHKTDFMVVIPCAETARAFLSEPNVCDPQI